LTAVVKHGQVLEQTYAVSPGDYDSVTAASECGIGGRRNGRPETFYTPYQLASGKFRVRVTAVGSACTASVATRRTIRTFRIVVH
jgi:hypothetical protein